MVRTFRPHHRLHRLPDAPCQALASQPAEILDGILDLLLDPPSRFEFREFLGQTERGHLDIAGIADRGSDLHMAQRHKGFKGIGRLGGDFSADGVRRVMAVAQDRAGQRRMFGR